MDALKYKVKDSENFTLLNLVILTKFLIYAVYINKS